MIEKRMPGAVARAQRRFARITAILSIVVAVCAYMDRETRAFDLLEQKTYGERMEVAGRVDNAAQRRARAQVVLVTLTDSSFSSPRASRARRGLAPQPFMPRTEHAEMIRRLSRCGAKVIGFDFLFDTPQAGDIALMDAIQSSRNVLLACGDDSGDPPRLLLPQACLLRAGAKMGHTRCPIDPDRPALDRVQPVITESGRQTPAFCVEAARMALGCRAKPLIRTPAGWRCDSLRIPIDEDDTFPVRYWPPDRAHFITIPYEDVLDSTPAQEAFYRTVFQGKIVLIGDTTRIHGDLHLTPLGMMSGVEIQAHAISTLLAGRFLRSAPWEADFAAMIVLVALAAVPTVLWRLRHAALFLAVLLPGYLFFNAWLFVEHDLAVQVVAPTVTVLVAALAILLERGLTEEQEKTRMRELLQRYVNPQIAAYLLKNIDLIGHSGRRAMGTVLFCDIRGFTALSERMPPEELVTRMNEYFEVMTGILFRHQGTVVSIAGDAILGVFGIPVPSADHARQAVAAAIEMQKALESIQARWRTLGHDVLDIGIGIHTGEMIVGDIGGRHLMNFTVYGLTVNTAARVEDLNKELGSRILMTQATYRLVQDEITVCGPIRKPIKGLELGVDVYEVAGWR